MNKDYSPTENEIQQAFFSWLDVVAVAHPAVSLFFSIPNGSHKSPAARGLFKRTGLKPGVPDVHLPVKGFSGKWEGPERLANGLWIEFKSKKGILSPEQKLWIEALRSQGHRVEVCRSWPAAANVVIEYLGLKMQKFKEAM